MGYLIGVASYVVPALYLDVRDPRFELDPYETQLPLTQPMLSIWRAMDIEAYVHEPTGQRFDVWTNSPEQSHEISPLGRMHTVYTLNDGTIVTPTSDVPRHVFMLVAHAFLAIASGYIFGKFAAIVYRRKTAASSSSEASRQELGGLTPSAQNDL